MGARTTHGPGTFCWVNLSTSDPDGAKRFYAALLGWEYDDRARDDGGFSMARRYGANVAAIYRREEPERAQGLAPHWNSYVSVSDADAAVARAQELGGSVVEGPFDAYEAGRTAALLDPAGAMFWVWQPRMHNGAGHVNDTGCLTWNELNTSDTEGAIEFYSSLFGWSFEQGGADDGTAYWVIGNDAAAMGRNGGMRRVSDEDTTNAPPMWIPYFTVDSAASAVEAAQALGGGVPAGAAPAGTGNSAMINDPTGAVFRVFDGEVDN